MPYGRGGSSCRLHSNTYSHKAFLPKANVTASSKRYHPQHPHFLLPQPSVNNGENLDVPLHDPGCTEDTSSKVVRWGTWVAQSDNHLTLQFTLGHDLRVGGSSPMWGSRLSTESPYDSLSLSFSLCPQPCSHVRALSPSK